MSAIGDPAPRGGGRGRVNGEQLYVADIHLPNELHVKLVTLPCARGRIGAIDATAAMQIPGVVAVFAAADLPTPMPRFGPQFTDRPVIAIAETKFHGDPVAAVAAETLDAAEEAARLVRVEYEELPAVTTIDAARANDAPLVQDPSIRKPNDRLANTNVLKEHVVSWGDLDAAAKHAELIVENTYRFPMVTHFAIEPHAFIAAPDGDGIKLWTSIQHPYWLQRLLAQTLQVPLAKVRVIAPDPGGAFGGKQHAKYEPLLAFMALKLQRPVRLVLTLEETFQAVRRTETEIKVRTGLTRAGKLVFQDVDADYLIGAYADIADRVVGKGSYIGCGPYNYEAGRVTARSVLSHTVPSTAMRGFGNPQVNWAVESNLTEAANQIAMDPVLLRLTNLAAKGDPFIPFDTPCDGDWAQATKRAAELAGWDKPKPEGRGRGFALGIKSGPTTGLSYSMVRLHADGSALVYCGTQDIGQGARTIFAQIAAHELGLPLEHVSVVMGDTGVVPYDQQTSASRSTVLMGNAVIAACKQVLEQRRAGRTGEIVGVGDARKEPDPDHPLGGSAAFFEFNATAVELSVDEGTGDITIHRHVTVSDIGKAINRLQVQMQDEGAAIMGLGHTLMERYIWDDAGRIRNLGAIDYRIPTSMDLPAEMISDMIENGDGPGPYGAKGMSEGALLPVSAAVAAAVRDATGAVIRDLPLSPERVWTALQERGGS
jgi:CO/xanthine dehydrogenase Mo-binding subunit